MMFRQKVLIPTLILAGALALTGCDAAEEPPSNSNTASESASPDATESESPSSEGDGTRESPVALGTEVSSPDWTVVVNSVELDATAAVADAFVGNSPADPGTVYILVNYTVTYNGTDAEGQLPQMVQVEFVTADGQTINTFDKVVLAPEPTFGIGELYPGASSTGNVVFQVPTDGAAGGVLAVSPGVLEDKVFVAVE